LFITGILKKTAFLVIDFNILLIWINTTEVTKFYPAGRSRACQKTAAVRRPCAWSVFFGAAFFCYFSLPRQRTELFDSIEKTNEPSKKVKSWVHDIISATYKQSFPSYTFKTFWRGQDIFIIGKLIQKTGEFILTKL